MYECVWCTCLFLRMLLTNLMSTVALVLTAGKNPTQNSYANNLNNQVFIISTRLSLLRFPVNVSTGWAGAAIYSRRVETIIVQAVLEPKWRWHKKFLHDIKPTHIQKSHQICDRNTFAQNNTYRNLTNCYHHPAGSFTTISVAIARVVYRHTYLMPVQMIEEDAWIHV